MSLAYTRDFPICIGGESMFASYDDISVDDPIPVSSFLDPLDPKMTRNDSNTIDKPWTIDKPMDIALEI